MSSLVGKLKEIDSVGFKEPARKLVLNRQPSCYSCGKELKQKESVWLSYVSPGVYCKDCGFPSRSKHKGEAKVASNVKLEFKDFGTDRGQIRADVEQEFKENDVDFPEDKISDMVDKRLEGRERELKEFEDEASKLSEFAN